MASLNIFLYGNPSIMILVGNTGNDFYGIICRASKIKNTVKIFISLYFSPVNPTWNLKTMFSSFSLCTTAISRFFRLITAFIYTHTKPMVLK